MARQVLVTKAIEDAIRRTPYGTSDGLRGAAKVIARYFNPYGGGTWYVLEGAHGEGEEWDGDRVYGFVTRVETPEYGELSLEDFKKVRVKVSMMGVTQELPLERDIGVEPFAKTLGECLDMYGEEKPSWWGR